MLLIRFPIIAIALLTVLGACAEVKTDYDVMKQKARTYVAAHPELTSRVAAAIVKNEIFSGMSMEQVTAAWGRPVVVQQFRNGAQQYWYFGCHWPHFCSGVDIGMAPRDQYQSRALFTEGKLIDWSS